MTVYNSISNAVISGGCVALGTFDGVHKGHAAVIGDAASCAAERGHESVVYCFSYPPRRLFSPVSIPVLTSAEDKIKILSGMSVDHLIMCEPSQSILSMTSEEFLTSIYEHLSPSSVSCGYDYTFGAGARGNARDLYDFFTSRGVDVHIIPAVTDISGEPVSSSRIRRMIEDGDTDVYELLGRRLTLRAVHKDGRHIFTSDTVIPGDGGYGVNIVAGEVRTSAHITVHDGVIASDARLPDGDIYIEF